MSRILLLDIETAPNSAYVWGLFDQNIDHRQVIATSYVLCWSAKWLGEKHMHTKRAFYDAKGHVTKHSYHTMLHTLHTLLSQAQVVVHFNGVRFDIPVVNREFIKLRMPPPPPYHQVDLYKVVKRGFRFESNKLAAVLRNLDLEGKLEHSGFEMWVQCMQGDAAAWKTMLAYNKQDVAALETLYYRLLPWTENHPSLATLNGRPNACPRCGVEGKLRRAGQAHSKQLTYQRFQCSACGGWCRTRTCEKGKGGNYV